MKNVVSVTRSNVKKEWGMSVSLPGSTHLVLKSLPSRISLAIDMKLKEVEKVLYFESFIVIEPGLTELKKGQLLTEDEFVKAQEKYGEDSFTAGIGAEAVREILLSIDLKKERDRLRNSLKDIKSKVTEERT